MDLTGFSLASREVLARAAREAVAAGNAHVGVEHFFLALLQFGGPDVRRALVAAAVDPERIEKVMRAWIRIAAPAHRAAERIWTPRLERVQTAARLLAAQYGSPGVEPGHFLLALLQENRAAPVRLLDAIRPSESGPVSACARRETQRLLKLHDHGDTAHEGPFFERFVEMGWGSETPVCGRDADASWVSQECLQGRFPLLLGDPGIGKRSVMRLFSSQLAPEKFAPESDPPSMLGRRLYRLNPASLRLGLREGRPPALQIEDFVRGLRQDSGAILLLEDLPELLDDSERVPTGILRRAIQERWFSCAATATHSEFARLRGADPELAHSFYALSLGALAASSVQEVLLQHRPSLEHFHEVQLPEETLLAAAQLAERFIPDEQLPGKALDLLDAACALPLLDGLLPKLGMGESLVAPKPRQISVEDVRNGLARTMHLDKKILATAPREALQNALDAALEGSESSGQKKIHAAVVSSERGPGCHVTLSGTPGSGRVALAKKLAEAWCGSAARLVRFELEEFFGPEGAAEVLDLMHTKAHKSPYSAFLLLPAPQEDLAIEGLLGRLPIAHSLSISLARS